MSSTHFFDFRLLVDRHNAVPRLQFNDGDVVGNEGDCVPAFARFATSTMQPQPRLSSPQEAGDCRPARVQSICQVGNDAIMPASFPAEASSISLLYADHRPGSAAP